MHTFDSVSLKPDQLARVRQLQADYASQESFIKANTQPGRLQSLALTALEESAMWANKAISREP